MAQASKIHCFFYRCMFRGPFEDKSCAQWNSKQWMEMVDQNVSALGRVIHWRPPHEDSWPVVGSKGPTTPFWRSREMIPISGFGDSKEKGEKKERRGLFGEMLSAHSSSGPTVKCRRENFFHSRWVMAPCVSEWAPPCYVRLSQDHIPSCSKSHSEILELG